MGTELYTTVEVAKMTKILRATLQFWIATRKIGEDRIDIWINFANTHDHFRDWPEEIRSAWFRAGGDFLS